MEPKLALYYSKYCFFCQKVLMFLRGKDLDLDLRSTSDREHAQALMQGGGKTQVPCLAIEQADGSVEWMYESDDIIRYLS
jgi:glutathione S-transferase